MVTPARDVLEGLELVVVSRSCVVVLELELRKMVEEVSPQTRTGSVDAHIHLEVVALGGHGDGLVEEEAPCGGGGGGVVACGGGQVVPAEGD